MDTIGELIMRDDENLEDMFERVMGDAYTYMRRAQEDIDRYAKAGKEIMFVACNGDTKRGDVIDIVPFPEEEEEEMSSIFEIPSGVTEEEEPVEAPKEEEEAPGDEVRQARVIAVHTMTGIDPRDMTMHKIHDAICVLLEPGDMTTEDEFAALYSDGEEPQEAPGEDSDPVEVAEPQDPNVCSCGANRAMCERNQNVFGGHLQ